MKFGRNCGKARPAASRSCRRRGGRLCAQDHPEQIARIIGIGQQVQLLEQACALMAQAKSCHDELETYYRTAVDFAQVDAAAAQCMELFGVG